MVPVVVSRAVQWVARRSLRLLTGLAAVALTVTAGIAGPAAASPAPAPPATAADAAPADAAADHAPDPASAQAPGAEADGAAATTAGATETADHAVESVAVAPVGRAAERPRTAVRQSATGRSAASAAPRAPPRR